MTRIGDVLGRKYVIDIMLYLLEDDTPPTKTDIFRALGCHRAINMRFNEMESEGLIEVTRDGGIHHRHHVRLTWYGKKIAIALKECEYLIERIASEKIVS